MTLSDLHDPLLLLYAGLMLDALFGERLLLGLFTHPVVFAGRAISWFDRHLNRSRRRCV